MRESERRADMLLCTSLRWTIERLLEVWGDALRAAGDVDREVRTQLEAANALISVEPIASASPIRPGRPEILALKAAGAPWGAVAHIAEELRDVETSLDHLAHHILMPDEDIRWRLFHLGVLGSLILDLQRLGFTVHSTRPIGGLSRGPSYEVIKPDGQKMDLWFEASGVWSFEGISAPYSESTQGIDGAGLALGADIMLISADQEALIIECKYSADPQVVARNGYHQAVTYATEAKSRLAGKIVSIVVAPTGVISAPGFTNTVAGTIGSIAPEHLSGVVKSFFGLGGTR